MDEIKIKKEYSQIIPFDKNQRVIDQFGFNPVSIIKPDKERKKYWKENGAYLDVIETRRSENCEYLPGLKFSEFHAGLAEYIVKYWSLPGELVIDPFSGRVTRSFVTANLERKYIGFEIAPNTYNRCIEHINKFSNIKDSIKFYNNDGCKLESIENETADLIYTCPPYFNIEKYENVSGQLSSLKTYTEFLEKIKECVDNCFRVIKPGRFICWVVADFRTGGELKSFSSDCIELFKKTGFKHWDTIIIENFSPFAALQCGKVCAKRYTSKIHEYLLVFRK